MWVSVRPSLTQERHPQPPLWGRPVRRHWLFLQVHVPGGPRTSPGKPRVQASLWGTRLLQGRPQTRGQGPGHPPCPLCPTGGRSRSALSVSLGPAQPRTRLPAFFPSGRDKEKPGAPGRAEPGGRTGREGGDPAGVRSDSCPQRELPLGRRLPGGGARNKPPLGTGPPRSGTLGAGGTGTPGLRVVAAEPDGSPTSVPFPKLSAACYAPPVVCQRGPDMFVSTPRLQFSSWPPEISATDSRLSCLSPGGRSETAGRAAAGVPQTRSQRCALGQCRAAPRVRWNERGEWGGGGCGCVS